MSNTINRDRVIELLPPTLFLGVAAALVVFFLTVVSPRMLHPMDGETWRATYEAPLLEAQAQAQAQAEQPEEGWVGYRP